MFETWSIGVFIRASSNIQQVMRGISGSSTGATAGINNVTAAAGRLRTQQLALKASSLTGAATVLGAGGILGAMAVGSSVAAAGRLQLSMAIVQNATSATNDELEKLRQTVMRVSGTTAQSADTIASEMAMAARSGLNSVGRLQAVFPSIAKFADVLWMMGKVTGQSISPQEAVQRGVQFAHFFQAYQPNQLIGTRGQPGLLDWVARLMMVQPEAISRLVQQGKYFVPFGRALGMKVPDIMALFATMGQTGFLLGRGGSSVGRTLLGIINAAQMTGFRQKKQRDALADLGVIGPGGITVLRGTGKNALVDWPKFMATLAGAMDRLGPIRYGRDLQAAFGVIATQLLASIETPGVRKQMEFIKSRMAKMGTVEDFFNNLINKFLPQVYRAATNLVNIGINIFYPLLPMLTKGFKGLADVLGRIGDFLAAHQSIAKALGLSAIGGTIAMLGLFGVTMVRLFLTLRALNVAQLAAVGIRAPGAISGLADILLITPLIRTVGAAFKWIGGIFRSLVLSGLLRGGMIGRAIQLLVWAITRLTSLPGIILLVITGLFLIWKYLPQIANWWGQHGAQVTYIIGYGFGMLARVIVGAVQDMFSAISSTLGPIFGTIKANAWKLLVPGGPTMLSHDVFNELEFLTKQKLSRVHQYYGKSGTQGLLGGFQGGLGGHRFQPGNYERHQVHIEHVNIVVKDNKAADDALDRLLKHPYTFGHATSRTSPRTPYHSGLTSGFQP